MGSQPAKYEETPQSSFTLQMGCDWKGRGDWTICTYLKTLLHSRNFQFLSSSNCTRDYLLHKVSLSRFWRSTDSNWWSDSAFFLSSDFLILSSKSEVLHLPRAWLSNISQKVMGGLLIFISILFGYAVNCQHCALQRRTWYNAFSDWDSNPHFRFPGPRF